jgi:TRAP-type mannitol/chloroaromatic compound transport system permease small subunit
MKVLEKLEAWFAAAMIIFFFLPWITISAFGFSDAGSGFNLGSTSGGFGGTLLYSSWLVLIMSIATIVMAAMGRETRTIGLATGIVAIVVVLYVFLWTMTNSKVESGGVSVNLGLSVGIGAWLTLLAGIGMIVAALGIIKSPMKAPAPTM